jgi:pimeloyl-ACP methyl ester carboxylesterase
MPVRRWGLASGFPARGAVRVFGRVAFNGAPPAWWHDHAYSVAASPGALQTWMTEGAHMDVSVLRPELVNIPVAVLQGAADRISPSSVAADLHRRIHGSRLVEIPGGSHMLANTHPAAIVDAVQRMIAR